MKRLSALALVGIAIIGSVTLAQQRTPTTFHGRVEIVYQGDTPIWNGSGYANEIGGFIDDGYFESDFASTLLHDFGKYGLFNSSWPDYWIYGLNLSVGYRRSSDIPANPDLRDVLHNGAPYTGNPYAPGGKAQWTISFYNNLAHMWAGDGPHPILDGNNGTFPNVYPNAGDRREHGNPFDPNTDNPYMTVAWGTVGSPQTTYVRYDAEGRPPGEPGYNPATAGFENGGYTVRHERITLTDAYGGGVWDFGPAGTYRPTTHPDGQGWGPTYTIEATLYHDPRNISGLFGGRDAYGNPYVWTAMNAQGDLSTFWYEAIPEPSAGALASLGLLGLLFWRRKA